MFNGDSFIIGKVLIISTIVKGVAVLHMGQPLVISPLFAFALPYDHETV